MVQPAKDWMRNNISEPLDLMRRHSATAKK
jgi:hypothetical protein